MIDGGGAGNEDQGPRGACLKALLVLLLCLGAFADLVLSIDEWSVLGWSVLATSVTVALIAVRSMTVGGRAQFTAAGAGATVSLIASAILGTKNRAGDRLSAFGTAEGTALTFLVVFCWRRAAGRASWAVTLAVPLDIPLLTLRSSSNTDLALLVTVALPVATVAVARGTALRAADAQRRVAVTVVRRTEREEVARQLHDVVAHHVIGMVVLTQASRSSSNYLSDAIAGCRGAPTVPRPSFDDAVLAVERAGAEALASLRSMVSVLRSTDADADADAKANANDCDGAQLHPTPTVEDIGEVVRRFQESGATARVDLSVGPAPRALSPAVQAVLHRVVLESLTKVSRYAQGAQRMHVDLDHVADHTVLTVIDTGSSAQAAPATHDEARWGGGFGIVGMREWVVARGGTLTAGPGVGADGSGGWGWTLRAEVPA